MPILHKFNDIIMDHRWAMFIATSSTGNTAMDNYKDSAGIEVAERNSTADEPGFIRAPWGPWECPAHAEQSRESPAQGEPAVRVPKPRLQAPAPRTRATKIGFIKLGSLAKGVQHYDSLAEGVEHDDSLAEGVEHDDSLLRGWITTAPWLRGRGTTARW